MARKDDTNCGQRPQAQLPPHAMEVDWQIINNEVSAEVVECIFTDFRPCCCRGSLNVRKGLVSLCGFYLIRSGTPRTFSYLIN